MAEKSKLQIGYKQTKRALNDNKALKVFLAENCDSHIKGAVEELANANNTPVFYVPTMKELGSMCSIDVGASCAVILL